MHPDDLPRVARALRERLEVNRLFGWSVPLRATKLRPSPAERAHPALTASRAPATVAPVLPGELGAERERRATLLAPVGEEVARCTRCALCHSRKQTVFGTGDPLARLVFVGEAPGFDEQEKVIGGNAQTLSFTGRFFAVLGPFSQSKMCDHDGIL